MKLVCINCPRGCKLDVENINGNIEVSGNFCPRGKEYAISEITNPVRTLTTTIKIKSKDYFRLPVISSSPIPFEKIFVALKELKNIEVCAPVKRGQIIIEKIAGTESNIVASKTIEM